MASLADKIHALIKPNADGDKERAKKITRMGQSEGWEEFRKSIELLIAAHMPTVTQFTPEGATQIAGQMAYISGLKRCLKIMADAVETAGPQAIDE